MHPTLMEHVARDHVRSLVHEAEAARLARLAGYRRTPRLRQRLGLGLIAAGNRLACDTSHSLAGVPGGRA